MSLFGNNASVQRVWYDDLAIFGPSITVGPPWRRQEIRGLPILLGHKKTNVLQRSEPKYLMTRGRISITDYCSGLTFRKVVDIGTGKVLKIKQNEVTTEENKGKPVYYTGILTFEDKKIKWKLNPYNGDLIVWSEHPVSLFFKVHRVGNKKAQSLKDTWTHFWLNL